MTEKRTRKVRRTEAQTEMPTNGQGYLENWSGVISGIVNLDAQAIHSKLQLSLRKPTKTGTSLMAALDRIAGEYQDACQLKDRARMEYDLYKEDYETFLEPKRTVGLAALEEAKKKGELKKTISDAMVMDYVRAAWPAEYNARQKKLASFRAAVHTIEELPRAFQMRARALSDQKEMLMKLGAGVAGE